MKEFVVTYLAALILFQGIFANTDILFEASELIEDYQLHKVKYGDDFSTFISKHFGDLKESHQKQHQKENEKHNHPIQNNTGNSYQIDYTISASFVIMKNEIEINSTTSNFHYADLFSKFEKQKIFQPPRLA